MKLGELMKLKHLMTNDPWAFELGMNFRQLKSLAALKQQTVPEGDGNIKRQRCS